MVNDLTFTGEIPVVINFNGSTSDIFAPISSSSCDINIVSPEILDDLYTSKKDDVKVKIEKDIYKLEKTVIHHPEVTEERVVKPAWDEYIGGWKIKDWGGQFRPFNGNFVWHDGEGNSYFCQQYWFDQKEFEVRQYKLVDGQWVNMELSFIPFTGPNTQYVWNDSEGHTYYSSGSVSYEFTGSEWVNKTMNKNLSGDSVWHDGEGHTYYSISNQQYEFVNGEWIEKDWGTVRPNWGGSIWHDGEGNTYCYASQSYTLMLVNDTWERISMNKNLDGEDIWYHNNHIYYSVTNKQYEFVNGEWVDKDWGELYPDWGSDVWYDNGNTYYTEGSDPIKDYIYEGEETVIHHPAETETVVIQPAWDEVTYTRVLSDTKTMWEGYMTPNTYTQELTQNLDEIALTAIDPVALLKYVKIDKIMSRPNVVSYRELIGKALAYVKLDSDILRVEDVVYYQDSVINPDSVLDMKVQVSNFWDEAGEPSTLYDMIGEMLRPFGLCLTASSHIGAGFDILSVMSSSAERNYNLIQYRINDDGTLTRLGERPAMIGTWNFDYDEWKSNNTTSTNVTINETYDKVTGVASTSIPNFSTMAFDYVDSSQRDLYDAGWLNVDRNPVKGYIYDKFGGDSLDTKDYWYYLWNGVYTNPDYHLVVDDNVNGFANINQAYKYLSGQSGNPFGTGSILNFYGGANNPIGTGKEQTVEKSVEVKKNITAYAEDNGVPPEFLERDDFTWEYSLNNNEGDYDTRPEIKKLNRTDDKYGEGRPMGESNKIIYHQEYPNMTLIAGSDQTVDIELSHTFSRTGIDVDIDPIVSSIVENRKFLLTPDSEGSGSQYWNTALYDGDTYCYPYTWLSSSVMVDYPYFGRYGTSGKLLPVWNERKVVIYIQNNNDSVSQFNGKEWVEKQEVDLNECITLKKLMNYQAVFNTQHKYDLIQCSDGTEYALNEDGFFYYTDRYGGVVKDNGYSTHRFDYYLKEGSDWLDYVNGCDEGRLSIVLPRIDAVNVNVVVDIYNSSMLGMTGNDTHRSDNYGAVNLKFEHSGIGVIIDPETQERTEITLTPDNIQMYGHIFTMMPEYDFIPNNASHIKAEHLDLSIEVSVPESNLGRMFGESDVKYTIDLHKNFLEQYEGPTFKVNTYHPLVASSFSYLIFDNEIADPDSFVFKQKFNVRPECYVVQGYLNFLSRIRKIYEKTLIPNDKDGWFFDNMKTYITTPEITTQGLWLKVVADSWDLQTNRHTIEAVEDYDMSIEEVASFSVVEIPRKSRADRYNYISVKKFS